MCDEEGGGRERKREEERKRVRLCRGVTNVMEKEKKNPAVLEGGVR